MLNLTLLSFTIASSFQKSSFIHLSSISNPSYSIFKKINAKYFFSSFLISQTFNSFSIVEESTFKQFITSLSVLSFKLKEDETTISNRTFYGDTIPSKNNIFYHTKYIKIINCKFMSITDDYNDNEQSILDGGLCIYSKHSTLIESCYFFAILSHRSGSCILFAEDDELTKSIVVYCMFKSITQHPLSEKFLYYSGGVISHGNTITNDGNLDISPIYYSETEYCCFDNIQMIESVSHSVQLGVVTYITPIISCMNLNFTNNKMVGYWNLYGMITYVCFQPMENLFAFINIFNCEYCQVGTFSLLIMTRYNPELSMGFVNFINNTKKDINDYPQFGIEDVYLNETDLWFTNIQCNSKEPFIGLLHEKNESKPIQIFVFNSLFGCSFSSFIGAKYQIVLHESSKNNIFDYSEFIVDVTNGIISDFGYIQTSQFSASNLFTIKSIKTSDFDFVVNSQWIPITVLIVAAILAVIVISFAIAILCCRGKIGEIYMDQFEQLDIDNEIDELENENMNKENRIELSDSTKQKTETD